MEIIQVATGLITIPPNGWGAVERLIWAYKQGLEKLGHTVEIKHINEVEYEPNKIVHCHLANLAIDCRNRGIPYVYSLHDHHTEWYGKDSWIYKQNLEAMKGSIISFTHAEYLVDYFDDTDKLFYLRHGADTNFFYATYLDMNKAEEIEHSLLMLANNGLAGDSGFDRKGFRYGIEAAKALNLPITIAGTPDNERFFDAHPDLREYDKLKLVLTNPMDDETRALYQSHTMFLHPSMLEAGHPNLTLMEAASCCIPIIGTYKGSQHIYGMWVIPSPSTENVLVGIQETIKTYAHRKQEMLDVRHLISWNVVCEKLSQFYKLVHSIKDNDSATVKSLYLENYNKI